MNIFRNIVFISVLLFVCSCSNSDKPSSLGKSIVEKKSPDNMDPGIYETINLTQIPKSYGSTSDDLSGLHIYEDILQNYGNRVSIWAIGNWDKEETILKLSHYTDTDKGENRISRILDSLIGRDTPIANPASVEAEIIWTNLTRYNSFDNANVEIGVIFSSRTDTNFFPLNFALVNPKNATNAVRFDIGTYLLEEKEDTAYIERYEAKYTNFVDTVKIVTPFTKIDNKWEPKKQDIKTTVKPANLNGIKFATDTLVSWRHCVASYLYDSINEINKNSLKLFSKGKEIGTIKHQSDITIYTTENFPGDEDVFEPSNPPSKYVYERIIDTLIITYTDTVIYPSSPSNSYVKREFGDSIVTHIRFTNGFTNAKDTVITGPYPPDTLSKPRSDTLIQTGYKYQTALNEPKKHSAVRGIGGKGWTLDSLAKGKILRDSLVMYLRVNNESRENIMHVTSPYIRISYTKKGPDTTRQYIYVQFTEKSVISFSKDNLTDNDAVISGGLQRLAKIELNLRDVFWETVTKERFLSIGLADLDIFLDEAKTDFPRQYGDSIIINALADTADMTPKELFSRPNTRRINYTYYKRDSASVRIPLSSTLTDYLYLNKVYKKSAPPKTYLYLWLDDWQMGRIYFKQEKELPFTYILQTRKGDE